MQRWWDSAEAARDALGRVDDSDVQMGVGTALLGYHALAKEALEPLASETLVDPSLIEAYLDGIDLEPVAKAISAAARAALPAAEADRYGWLMATDTHHQALAATPRLATALVAKGTSWPKAVARASEIVGVPLNRLGRYPEEVSKAGLDSLSVSDVADRSLMTWAAAISGSVPLESVSKRGRERERGHEPEKEKFDESEVKRDEHGRFAEEADHQQRLAREARKRRKARRQRRQAAAQAVEKPKQAKERVQSKVKARAMGKARTVTPTQARALVASSAKERPRQMMELDEARRAEEMDLPDDTGAFGLKQKGPHYTIWDDSSLGTDYYPTYTTTPVDPNEAQSVMDANDLLKALGGPEAFNGKETFHWDSTAAKSILGLDDDTPRDEVEAGIASLPPVTLADYDPNQHIRHVSMSPTDALNFDQFFVHAPGALPMRSMYDSPVGDHLVRRTATLDELPAGSTWETIDESVLSTSVARTNWVDQDGRAHHIVFDFPSIRQSHTANGVTKAERTRSRERSHSNAPERWDETQVKRDEQGQFAAEGSAEQKQAVEDRAARKRRRNKRRARQAAFAEAKAQVKERPKEKARERVRGKARAFVSGKARERNKQLVHGRSLTQVQSRQTTSDEYPLGLTMHTRNEAPDMGPYTLDEPLYTRQVADGTTPQLVMTEDEMTQMIRSKLTVGTRSAKTVNTYGEKIQSWPEPGGHSHLPTIRRYEPGTLPIGGRNPQGVFFTASDDQINQQWESAPYSGEGPSEIDFMVAAPGDQYDRRPKKVTVMVENVITTFTKSDVAKAKTKERERAAQNAPERWDETKVKRDEQGQFAAEQSDEAKAARVRRKARKARRAKRAARAAAWKERNAPVPAKERTRSAVKARAQAKARERVLAAVQSNERLRPARGRVMSKVAERVLHEETPPDSLDWLKALLNPQDTEMGEFLGQAGYKPYTTSIDIIRLEKYAPMQAENLHDGKSVLLSEIWDDIETGEGPLAPSSAYATVMSSVNRGLVPANQHDIFDTTVKILVNAFDEWKPVDGGAGYKSVGDRETHLRHKPEAGHATILGEDGTIFEGRPYLSQMGSPSRPIVVGSQAAVTLRQIGALIAKADGTGSNEMNEKLAAEGWKKVNETSAFGTPPIEEADPSELRQTAVDLMNLQKLAIHAMPDGALEETARLAMSKQKEPEVRLDNRGVFLITSRLETKNGWDRVAELKEKR